MVRVRVRVISGYDVMLNMCTAVRTNFKLLYDKFHPPGVASNSKPTDQNSGSNLPCSRLKLGIRVKPNLETLTLL